MMGVSIYGLCEASDECLFPFRLCYSNHFVESHCMDTEINICLQIQGGNPCIDFWDSVAWLLYLLNLELQIPATLAALNSDPSILCPVRPLLSIWRTFSFTLSWRKQPGIKGEYEVLPIIFSKGFSALCLVSYSIAFGWSWCES